MKYYSEEHQWVEVEGDEAKIGITKFAADELDELSYVELPSVGASFKKGDPLCVVESKKAVSDVFMPVGGTVVEVNAKLEKTPELVNEDAEGAGWICKIKGVNAAELADLMDEEKYLAGLK